MRPRPPEIPQGEPRRDFDPGPARSADERATTNARRRRRSPPPSPGPPGSLPPRPWSRCVVSPGPTGRVPRAGPGGEDSEKTRRRLGEDSSRLRHIMMRPRFGYSGGERRGHGRSLRCGRDTKMARTGRGTLTGLSEPKKKMVCIAVTVDGATGRALERCPRHHDGCSAASRAPPGLRVRVRLGSR